MLRLKEGDSVRIVARAQTPADARAGLYFPHYGNLSGTVFKLYGKAETQQAAIEVDQSSLPADIAARHGEARKQMLAALRGDVKRSRNSSDADFYLRYVVLVGVGDLTRSPAARRVVEAA